MPVQTRLATFQPPSVVSNNQTTTVAPNTPEPVKTDTKPNPSGMLNSARDKTLQSKLNDLARPVLHRSKTASAGTTKKLAPDVRRFDTLLHPASSASSFNAGTLMIGRNNQNEWTRIDCGADQLLQNIEVRPEKGLLNLTGSDKFCSGELNQTQKRDLQRAVTCILMTYNELAAQNGGARISIHENHIEGDGKTYENRDIPRKANEQDYDYYHTLGVNFADNGKMLPHYHLEFEGALDKQNVGIILENLKNVGHDALGKCILTQEEIDAVLDKLPDSKNQCGFDAHMVNEKRQLLPNEIASAHERASVRNDLETHFIALSSHNTELAAHEDRLFLRNAHMNSFRPAEPMFECFSAGQVSVMDDLAKIEKYQPKENMDASEEIDVGELLDIHYGLSKAANELKNDKSAPTEQRQEIEARFADGISKIQELLSTQ